MICLFSVWLHTHARVSCSVANQILQVMQLFLSMILTLIKFLLRKLQFLVMSDLHTRNIALIQSLHKLYAVQNAFIYIILGLLFHCNVLGKNHLDLRMHAMLHYLIPRILLKVLNQYLKHFILLSHSNHGLNFSYPGKLLKPVLKKPFERTWIILFQ
ncbi:hypothetical protein CVT25_008510 [Psilocybe cyanescens]|uniref:Uncharacterized protein n=1 Tax=Psilocybe cyanescens TaxID=93625 RepID=A0A409XNK9_PSICY|nr:hypothetical protein CVT25_008510 [Psilocybe cyanescens]